MQKSVNDFLLNSLTLIFNVFFYLPPWKVNNPNPSLKQKTKLDNDRIDLEKFAWKCKSWKLDRNHEKKAIIPACMQLIN